MSSEQIMKEREEKEEKEGGRGRKEKREKLHCLDGETPAPEFREKCA